MSLIRKSSGSLSSNDKVIFYLQHSTNKLFSIQQHRLRCGSENDSSSSSSSSSIMDILSRSDCSTESSLSDPVAHCSITSSNISSDEDLDFNIGFDQISDNDDDDQYILNKNNADAVTLLGESILDARINEFDEYLCQSSNSTMDNDEYDFDNDDKITYSYTKQRRASFIHDSNYTLCSQDRFSAYTEDDQENERMTKFTLRSNSLSVFPIGKTSTFLEKAPKKVVRFADMLGLDLESIRYMSPPDQPTTSIIQECVRLQLGQLHLSKSQLDIPNIPKQSISSLSLSSPTKQYNLISKNFISPINIIPLIYEKQVLLECLYTKNSTAYGTIRVHNCSYNKRVFIRLTQDEWKTSNNIEAWHSMNYPNDNTDTFTFEITLSKSIDDITVPKRILFSICLQSMSQEFWDNNQGSNYVLDVLERR